MILDHSDDSSAAMDESDLRSTPEQVVGSSIKTRFEMKDGAPTLFRLPDINFIDDKTGKPIGINEHIGRRVIGALILATFLALFNYLTPSEVDGDRAGRAAPRKCRG